MHGIIINLTDEQVAMLDAIRGVAGRDQMARALLIAVLEDDAAAHAPNVVDLTKYVAAPNSDTPKAEFEAP